MTKHMNALALWSGIAIIYAIGAQLGLLLAFEQANTSPVWPPAGIALAAILMFGYRAAPGIFLGAMFVNSQTGIPLWTAFSIGIGNTLGAVTAVILINLFTRSTPFTKAKHVLLFSAFIGIASVVSAVCGVSSLLIAGAIDTSQYKVLLFTWWVGDAVGGIVLTPFLLLWFKPFEKDTEPANYIEAFTLAAATTVICSIVYTPLFFPDLSSTPISFIFLPLAIWSAYRFLHRGATLFGVYISIIAIVGTLHGYGPFVSESANASLILLQSFIGILVTSCLVLASSIKEKVLATTTLMVSKNRLEHNVAIRTQDLQNSNSALSTEIEQHQSTIQALHTLLDATAVPDRNRLLHKCLSDLADMYNTRFAFVGVFADETKRSIRTIAVKMGNEFVDNFTYDLKGTPCEDVLNGKAEIIRDNAPKAYPEDDLLIKMGIESYFGAPLIASNNETLGILVIMDVGPLEIKSWSQPILSLYANRLGIELERYRNQQEQQLAEKVFDASVQSIAISDAKGHILRTNSTFEKVSEYKFKDLKEKNIYSFFADVKNNLTPEEHQQILLEKGEWQGELFLLRKNGIIYPASLSATAIYEKANHNINHIVWLFRDVTEEKASEAHIYHLAHYDPLTGLLNRSAFHEQLNRAITTSLIEQTALAIIYLDLDHFKLINDASGHSAGDILLQRISERLKICLNKDDIISRLGGDEFVMLVSNYQDLQDIKAICEKIIGELARPIKLNNNVEVIVTSSLGVSCYPKDGPDSHTLMKNADTAMYTAKQKGRNNYQFFAKEMNEHAAERLAMEVQLRQALQKNEFELHYQPQINVATNKITGCEALLRWNHPERGLVPPFEFIPIAEETGLIQDIGEWVIEEACRQQSLWREQGIADLKMGVNISSRQFTSKNLIASIKNSIDQSGIPPNKLDLELTESSVMENVDDAITILRSLKDMGLSLSIDDFGTGYSSLAYLKQFPIDRLKIDRSFVRDIAKDSEDAAIVTATISLSYNLHMAVIAEGVESEEQIKFLKHRGCVEMQGYHFCKPLPVSEITQFLKDNQNKVA